MKVSLADPHELNLEYLSNSARLKYINRYSDERTLVSFTRKTTYEEETIYVLSVSLCARVIFSPFLEVTVTYAKSSGFTNLYGLSETPDISALVSIKIFWIDIPFTSSIEYCNSLLRSSHCSMSCPNLYFLVNPIANPPKRFNKHSLRFFFLFHDIDHFRLHTFHFTFIINL